MKSINMCNETALRIPSDDSGGTGVQDGGAPRSRAWPNSLGQKGIFAGIGDVTNSQEKAHFSASIAEYWRAFLKLKMTTHFKQRDDYLL